MRESQLHLLAGRPGPGRDRIQAAIGLAVNVNTPWRCCRTDHKPPPPGASGCSTGCWPSRRFRRQRSYRIRSGTAPFRRGLAPRQCRCHCRGATEPVEECGRVAAGIGQTAGAHPEHDGAGAGIEVRFPGNRDLTWGVGAETHNSRARHAPAVRAGCKPSRPIVKTVMLRPVRVGIQDEVGYPRSRNLVPDRHRRAERRAIQIRDPQVVGADICRPYVSQAVSTRWWRPEWARRSCATGRRAVARPPHNRSR